LLTHIVCNENHFDYDKDLMLLLLIASKETVRFKRGSDWVCVWLEPISKSKRDHV
jgi:hypothetical protein